MVFNTKFPRKVSTVEPRTGQITVVLLLLVLQSKEGSYSFLHKRLAITALCQAPFGLMNCSGHQKCQNA